MEIVAKGNLIKEFCGVGIKADINMSDIYSFLIKEVGTKVTHYASDLFYDLKEIDDTINHISNKPTTILIGLREMGVDSTWMITHKMEHFDVYNVDYIVIYKIVFEVDVANMEITVTLTDDWR